MLYDLRFALRFIRRRSGSSATAVLTIAVAIAATTAVFSILDNVLFQPLRYPRADRLVRVWEENPGSTTAVGSMSGNRWLSGRTFQAWMEHPRTIDVLGSYSSYPYMAEVNGEAFGVRVSPISPTLLAGLADRALLGRLFSPTESGQPVASVAILSEPIWRARFGADPAVLGRAFSIEGRPSTIVGVLPSTFQFPDRDTQVWVPLAINGATAAFTAVARLRPGVSSREAEVEGTAAARSTPRPASEAFAFGTGGGPAVVHARRLDADITRDVRPALLVLAVGVGLLLLVGCANVANLLLSRGVARQREIAVRTALGASGGRLAMLLFTESLLLAIGGGILGVTMAWLVVRLIPALAPATFPRLAEIQMSAGVLAFAFAATIVTALASGLIPALRGTQLNVAESLRGGDGAITDGFRGARAARWRDVLLATEAAFAVVLLVGATLLAHSFVRLMNVDNGYDAEHVLAAHVRMPRGETPARTQELITATLERIRATPGILAAGAGDMMPLLRMTAINTFTIPPREPSGLPTVARARMYIVTPGYAEALRLRLIAGRLFDDRDSTRGIVPMLVNKEFVRQYLDGQSVVGRRLENLDNQRGVYLIVGVIGNVLKDGNDTRAQPEMYFVEGPQQQITAGVSFVIRTSGDPESLAGTLRSTIQSIDRSALVDRVEPLTSDLAVSMAQPRFAAIALGLFAGMALLLAAFGLYSVLSHGVSHRRRELALRTALGATKRDLIVLVVRDGVTVTGIGIAVGLIAAATVVRFMRSALFGITPHDPVTFVIAPVILLLVATVACVLPARRASSGDPAEVLRAE
jgi:putative ABC transport system permease protein